MSFGMIDTCTDNYYHIYPKYWDRKVWVTSVDPDPMLHSAASDQGSHCLPLIQWILDTTTNGKMTL